MAEYRHRVGRAYIVGYQVDIHKGLWEPVKTLAAPRVWAALWLAGWLSVAFACAMLVGVKWGVALMGVWLLGHGTMVVLTFIDPRWDEVVLAQLIRGYKASYGAG
jgi:type IV secretory pathway TrbD component